MVTPVVLKDCRQKSFLHVVGRAAHGNSHLAILTLLSRRADSRRALATNARLERLNWSVRLQELRGILEHAASHRTSVAASGRDGKFERRDSNALIFESSRRSYLSGFGRRLSTRWTKDVFNSQVTLLDMLCPRLGFEPKCEQGPQQAHQNRQCNVDGSLPASRARSLAAHFLNARWC